MLTFSKEADGLLIRVMTFNALKRPTWITPLHSDMTPCPHFAVRQGGDALPASAGNNSELGMA